jgi:GxxExxY protein
VNQAVELNDLSRCVIGAAIEVHRHVGPGLLESAYQACLAEELRYLKIPFEEQVPLPLAYRGRKLDCGYRLDFVVGTGLVLELNSVDQIAPIHVAQLLSYLRLSNRGLGLLINFNVPVLKNGIRRVVNQFPSCPLRLCGEIASRGRQS